MAALTVNGEAIDEAALRREAAAMLKLMAERMPKENPSALRARAREWAEENLIEATLMRQAALSDPEPLDAPEGCSAEDVLRLRMDRLVARVTAASSPPRHKDVVEYYRKNRAMFDEPESIRVAHIVKKDREGIERAREELGKGRSFAEVADELSDEAGQGGELGYLVQGQMGPAFDEVVFRMAPGELSEVFETETGFHIATVLDRRLAGIRKLEEVQERIAEHLLSEKKQKRLHQYVDNLHSKAVIERG